MDIDLSRLTVDELDSLIAAAATRRAIVAVPHADTPPEVMPASVNPRWFLNETRAQSFPFRGRSSETKP